MRLHTAGPVQAAWALPTVVACWLVVACRDRGTDQPPGTTSRPAVASSLQVGPEQALEPSPRATPLHLAALAGNVAAVESLLRAGADPVASDTLGAKPIHYAARAGHRDVVEVLLASVESLLSRPGPMPFHDNVGDGPLHYAARGGHRPVVELLLARGFDPRGADDAWVTALHEAARSGHLAVVELLLAAGARARVSDGFGNTPLSLARAGGHQAVARRIAAMLPETDTLLSLDTLAFDPGPARDFVWRAYEVTPLAYHSGDWWVAIANQHSDIEGGESPCGYRTPWSGAASDGGMWIERWRRIYRDSVSSLERAEIAAQTLTASQCTPQAEIDRRFAAAVRRLRGRLSADAVWALARADTFRLHSTQPRRLRYRVVRDSTVELYTEADLGSGERTLVCFAGEAVPTERCIMIDTPRGSEFEVVNRVTAVSAAVYRDTVWVFGLRTHGETVEPAWASQPIGVVPVFLGRLPLGAAQSEPARP